MIFYVLGIHGGVSGQAVIDNAEELWIVGGGNGTAFRNIFVLRYSNGSFALDDELEVSFARFGHCGATIDNKIVIVGGQNDGIVEMVEVIDMDMRTVEWSEEWSPPHRRWGSLCLPYNDQMMMMMGGMDDFFLPHNTVDILDLTSMTWSPGPRLPWSQSGGSGSVTSGGPTLFSGYSLQGYQRHVTSLSSGGWVTWDQRLDSARVSGAAVTVPSDIMDVCL